MTRKQKIIIFGGAIIFVILMIFVLNISTAQPKDTVAVTITPLPDDSKVTLDGKQIGAGKMFLAKGIHTFTVSRQYFTDVTKKVDTAAIDQKNAIIYLLPKPESPEAFKYLEDHPEVQRLREQAGGYDSAVRREQREINYPIVDRLPYTSINFKVDYGADDDDKLFLVVTLKPYSDPQRNPTDYKNQLIEYKAEALKFLKDNGVDTAIIPVEFKPDPDKK